MENVPAQRPILDEQLDALAHEVRRRVLLALLEKGSWNGGSVKLDEVVGGGEEPRIVAQHSHLPKLEGLGLVRWDRDGSRVARGPQFDEIEPLLQMLADNRDELL